MKMVMIVYNEAMDMEVMEVLHRCVLKNYTKIPGVFGKGSSSGTHMGDDIWPGKNNILYVSCKDDEAVQLLTCVKNLRVKLRAEGIKAFAWNLQEITE